MQIDSNFTFSGFKYPERIYSTRHQIKCVQKPALMEYAPEGTATMKNLTSKLALSDCKPHKPTQWRL